MNYSDCDTGLSIIWSCQLYDTRKFRTSQTSADSHEYLSKNFTYRRNYFYRSNIYLKNVITILFLIVNNSNFSASRCTKIFIGFKFLNTLPITLTFLNYPWCILSFILIVKIQIFLHPHIDVNILLVTKLSNSRFMIAFKHYSFQNIVDADEG